MSRVVDSSEPLTRNSGHGWEGSLTQEPFDSQTITGLVDQRGACASDSVSFYLCLRSNFSTLEHHFVSSSPDLLFLSENQLSANVSSGGKNQLWNIVGGTKTNSQMHSLTGTKIT